MSRTQFQKYRESHQTLTTRFSEPHKILFVHYSCESFYDRDDGTSPRITSIAVRSLENGQTKSFYIHQEAELQGKEIEDINLHYNELEKEMLIKFYEFVLENLSCFWFHWNMRDANYGFEALGHRFRVLGGEPNEIQDSNKIDLARLMHDFLGQKYVEHPRLYNLLVLNNMLPRNFLQGADEAAAFQRGEYVKLHQSTLSKVDALMDIAQAATENRLRSNNGYFSRKGLSLGTVIEIIKDHPIYVALGVLATVIGIIGSIANLL